MQKFALALGMGLFAALPLQADPVTEALKTAIEAYEDGDIQYALDEITNAQRLIAEQKTAGLAGFLPEAPAGWTRELAPTEANPAMAFMGGGIFAEASYHKADRSDSFTIKLIADNPMVAQMGAMLGNSTLIAQMGKVRRINRVRFLEQDRTLQAMIGNRVLLQAEGAAADAMEPALATMDLAALEKFGS